MPFNIEKYLDSDYVSGILGLFLIVYASMSQIVLPNWLVSVFKNDIFRVLYLSLLLLIPFNKAPHVAIIIAILYVIIIGNIYRLEHMENVALVENFKATISPLKKHPPKQKPLVFYFGIIADEK
jgi:hypothetical protein